MASGTLAMQELEDKTWEILIEGSPPGTETVREILMTDLMQILPDRLSEDAKKLVAKGNMLLILLYLATKHNLTLRQHLDLSNVTVVGQSRRIGEPAASGSHASEPHDSEPMALESQAIASPESEGDEME